MPWRWEQDTNRYRDTETGRFLSSLNIRDLAEERVRITGASTDGLASMLANDQLNVGDWEALMRQTIKDQYIQEYLLGRGGLSQMTAEDWGSIGGMLADQYRYLGPFAREIAAGNLSEAQIAARSRMYIHSSREALSRAIGRAQEWPELPAYPGDGSTECLTNCRCWWIGKRVRGAWEFTWVVDHDAESCGDCLDRGVKWAPLVIGD